MFITKDETLVELAVLTCLKYWPVINPTNEVATLSEIETYLNLIRTTQHLKDSAINLIERISICTCSMNWMVAERALMMVHHPVIVQLLDSYPEDLVPILVDGIGINIYKTEPEDSLFVPGKRKSTEKLKNRKMTVVPANFDPNYSFTEGPHWNSTVKGLSILAIKKLGDEIG